MAGFGWCPVARGSTQYGRGIYALCPGTLTSAGAAQRIIVRAERDKSAADAAFRNARRSRTLYILWALTAFPLQLYIQRNSIVYMNQATNNTIVALLYVTVPCGSLFFSQIRMMMVFGAANLAIF